ncbi:MAG: argininosuccinate synthase [Candidatus Saccharimonadales bacterium]
MKKVKPYQKVASYEATKGTFKKCLLLYSGGLDTSVMLKWIQKEYDCKIVALTINIGQTSDNLENIKQKALDLGAIDAITYDAQNEFADKLLSTAIKANADYQGGYALSTPLGRVIISQIAVKIAKQYGCTVIAHGCTGKGNDQVRFEGYITTLDPTLKIIAPVREWGMGRQEEIAYAKEHNIPIKQTVDIPYSYDENMWGNTGEGGEIEDPSLQPKLHDILQWCNEIEATPDMPTYIKITFDKGVPVKFNNKKMPLAKIIASCNTIGAEHGVGVVQLIEDRLVGLKVRGVYENPAATILINAHKKLEQLVSTREENQFKTLIDTKWAYMLYAALWFEPTMNHINVYIDDQNMKVCGEVTIKLFKGQSTVVALDSPYSLFDHNLATFEKNSAFNQNASAGFIEIYNLPQKTAYGVFNNGK